MDAERFEELVLEALDELPQEFKLKLENVTVQVEEVPTREQLYKARVAPYQTLFGLYEGVPKTVRGNNYTFVLPDKITIFQRPIEYFFQTDEAIKEQVKKTVRHEIGHHFGLTDRELRKKNH